MRILITGAGGQLGHDLMAVLAADDLKATDLAHLDITNRAAVVSAVAEFRPDWIINSAAYNDVDGAESAQDEAFAINAYGPGNLADAAAEAGVKLVHISSDYVFDGRKGSAYTEEDEPNPLNMYGRSKREGELRVLNSRASACVLRTAWLYGLNGKNFVKAILNAAKRGEPLKVVADQIGSPTSSSDLAHAISSLIRTPARGLFHVVNAGACSRFEFAKAIVRGSVRVDPITTAEDGRRAHRPLYTALASVRWEATGLAPLRPWEAALDDFLESYQGLQSEAR